MKKITVAYHVVWMMEGNNLLGGRGRSSNRLFDGLIFIECIVVLSKCQAVLFALQMWIDFCVVFILAPKHQVIRFSGLVQGRKVNEVDEKLRCYCFCI